MRSNMARLIKKAINSLWFYYSDSWTVKLFPVEIEPLQYFGFWFWIFNLHNVYLLFGIHLTFVLHPNRKDEQEHVWNRVLKRWAPNSYCNTSNFFVIAVFMVFLNKLCIYETKIKLSRQREIQNLLESANLMTLWGRHLIWQPPYTHTQNCEQNWVNQRST